MDQTRHIFPDFMPEIPTSENGRTPVPVGIVMLAAPVPGPVFPARFRLS
jgi:hypothetical protein